LIVKKVGRKALLTEEERRQLCEDYARYQRVTRRYQRILQKIAPQALARRYNISPATVLDYARGRHKGGPNYGLTGVGRQRPELA